MKNKLVEIEKISLYSPLEISKELELFLIESSEFKEEFLDASNFIWDCYLKYLNRVPDKGGYFANIEALLVSKIDKNIIVTNLNQSDEYKAKNKIPDVDNVNSTIEFIEQNKTNILNGFSVKIYAPFGTSGYSDAVLDYIYLITMNGGEVSFVPTDLQGRVDENTAKNIKYQIAINCMYKDIEVNNIWIYTTPLVWESIVKIEKNKNENVKTYGMYIWETDNLRDEVIFGMNNSVDVVLATSDYNIDIFKKYITKPLYCIHHVIRLLENEIDANVIKGNEFLSNLQKSSEDNFIFYVIAHWNPRKDIDKLLNAFNKAFNKDDKVKLVLKTFLHSHGEENNVTLKTYIDEKYNNENILLNFDLMTIEEIQELHKLCDCFVSTSHSEGVGFSVILAAMQNQVLAPNFSGYMNYIKKVEPINYVIENVNLDYPPIYKEFEKYYPDYKSNMKWASADIEDLIKQLKDIKNNTENKSINRNINRIYTANNFSYNNILGEIIGIFNLDNIYKTTLNIVEKFINQELEFNVLRSYARKLFIYKQEGIYIKACNEIRKKYEISEMHYVFQYFESSNSERQYEMDYCLENILINPFITKVHCLSEKEYNFSQFFFFSKIQQNVIADRLTFKKAFEYCNDNLHNQVCIFANNDIYFDSSLFYITELEKLENYIISLSRYDYNINNNKLDDFIHTSSGVYEYSQDVWVFKTPIKTLDDMEFFQGVMGCDNRIAYLFDKLGYYVVNPCETIRTTHMHVSEVRNQITNCYDNRFATDLKKVYSSNIQLLNNVQNLFNIYFDRNPNIKEFNDIFNEIEIYKKDFQIDLKFIRKIFISVIEERSYELLVDIFKDGNVVVLPRVKELYEKNVSLAKILEQYFINNKEYVNNNLVSIENYYNQNIIFKEQEKIVYDPNYNFNEIVKKSEDKQEVKIKNVLIEEFRKKYLYSPNNSEINELFKLYNENDNNNLEETLEGVMSHKRIIEHLYSRILGRNLDIGSLEEQIVSLKLNGLENYIINLKNSEEAKDLKHEHYFSKLDWRLLI